MRLIFLLGALALTAFWPVLAQDAPTVSPIQYDAVVEDSITASAFFDWWQVQAARGDVLVLDMAAAGGLEPLLAILGPSGDVLARSEEGAANATVRLEYTVPADGQYTIVATRAGSAEGASTGAYALRLRRANPLPTPQGAPQPVVFRCQDFEATTVATLRFADDFITDRLHRITVYGLDGFKPAIRATFTNQPDFEECTTDAQRTVGDAFTLPGGETQQIAAETLDTAAQLAISGAENAGTITLTLASRDGAPGRYLALIEGFTIDPARDVDMVEVGIGPLAARSTELLVYMVAAQNSRLDPFMSVVETDQACDDASRGDCGDVLTFDGAVITLNDRGGATLRGDRNDAGLRLAPGGPDLLTLELRSRGGSTFGGYALALIGELPLRRP